MIMVDQVTAVQERRKERFRDWIRFVVNGPMVHCKNPCLPGTWQDRYAGQRNMQELK